MKIEQLIHNNQTEQYVILLYCPNCKNIENRLKREGILNA